MVGDGVGDTFIHIVPYRNKIKIKINTSLAFLKEVMQGLARQGGDDSIDC